MAVRVAIVDDMQDIRELMRIHLELDERFELVGEGENGREAIDVASKARPDVIVLDVQMPLMTGTEAIPEIRNASPETKILLYSAFPNPIDFTLPPGQRADASITKGSPEKLIAKIAELAAI